MRRRVSKGWAHRTALCPAEGIPDSWMSHSTIKECASTEPILVLGGTLTELLGQLKEISLSEKFTQFVKEYVMPVG